VILMITVCVFLLCLLLLLPLTEMFPTKYLHNTVNIILSKQKTQHVLDTSSLTNKVKPLITFVIFIYRIDEFSPKWNKYRESVKVAGLDKSFKLEQLIGLKYLSMTIIALYFILLSISQSSLAMLILGFIVAGIGFYLPDQWLKLRVKKRRSEIQKEIPSILISLAVTTDAGLSLFQAIEEVCKRKSGALTHELQKTLQEITVGIPQKEAFENLANRVLVEELTLFVSVLIQTIEKGSAGITIILRDQANLAWVKRKSKARELGEKASIKLFLPLIGFILPALMIFLIVPAIFSILKFFV
jgi:tight adherence protein C